MILKKNPNEGIEKSEYTAAVAAYYEGKTESIIDKYGPGPVVHYHTGLFTGEVPTRAGTTELRGWMRAAQETLLRLMTPAFPLRIAGFDLLDVGCGLGGPSIFWARELGARVTAITNVRRHLELARRFAAEAGVGERITFILADAHHWPGNELYDAVAAVESTGYLERFTWLDRCAASLKRGGVVQILDWVRGCDEKAAAAIDGHWGTHLGSIAEYRDAARQAGLSVEIETRLNDQAIGFWKLAGAWCEAASEEREARGNELERLRTSRREIAALEAATVGGGVSYYRLVLKKPD
jgi:tocopherol O-methyltransferase